MKTSKTLTSAVVAAAILGGIGLAYAQTQDPSQSTQTPGSTTQNSGSTMPNSGSTTMPNSGSTMQNQPATTMQNQPSSADMSATPATRNTAGMRTERPAQADRN